MSINYTYFLSEVWLVPKNSGGFIPTTFRCLMAEVVRALNHATSGAKQGSSLKVYIEDLISTEIQNGVARVRFTTSGKGSLIEALLGWSATKCSVKLGCECRLQPAVLPAHEDLVKSTHYIILGPLFVLTEDLFILFIQSLA